MLHELALIKDKDFIGITDSAEPMGDLNHCM